MKLPKVLLINNAQLFNSLNLAIGVKAMKVFELQDEVDAIVQPFIKFRIKLAEDMGITGNPQMDKEEDFAKYVESLTKYAEGDVELKNSNFLTEDEFSLAVNPLTSGKANIELMRNDLLLLKAILVEQDNKEE